MKLFRLTLRLRIFLSMILIIILSFLVTGAISYYHYKKENEQYHRARLQRKQETVMEAIDYFLSDQTLSSSSDSIVAVFNDKICELADINRMDINLYSMEGNLLISSTPQLHEINIVPDRIPHVLMRQLREGEEQVIVKQQTDSIAYLSTYSYIHNSAGKPISIVNLPYFDVDDYHREDLRDFLIRLSQIYFILFLTATLLAYLLSNYITSSLNTIAGRIKQIRFSESNPRLNWSYDDEIGTLVAEYNRMLEALEESAKKLAKKERESAWKEMARQVAHEIKNPLTPMRLNVQYLANQLQTDEPEKLKNFRDSMLEQIDILSNIATAFSQFANMPEMKFKSFRILDVVERVTRLYQGRNIRYECDEKLELTADKEQLVRALNNLVNNALQAMPEGREEKIEIKAYRENQQTVISVSDNGFGIPGEMQAKIFEPRFTTKSSGMGLGLAMVKNIVDGFGGSIDFKSKDGEGTTFYLRF